MHQWAGKLVIEESSMDQGISFMELLSDNLEKRGGVFNFPKINWNIWTDPSRFEQSRDWEVIRSEARYLLTGVR